MITFLTIYIIIIFLIIFKGFYKSIPFIKNFSARKNTELIITSIQIESLSFLLIQKKIDLFIFFINFLLLIFFFTYNFNSNTFCLGFENEIQCNLKKGKILKNEIINIFEISPFLINNISSLFGNSFDPINGPFDKNLTSFEILNKKINISISYHYPFLEVFNFPVIDKLNYYNSDFLNIFYQSKKEFRSMFISDRYLVKLLQEFPLENTTLIDYKNQLDYVFKRNSLFMSKLFLVHNKTCNSFLFFNNEGFNSEIQKLLKSSNTNTPIILPENLITYIKSFILNVDYVNNKMLKLNQRIFNMSLFLFDFNLKINTQISILNNNAFSNINLTNFKNLFNFETIKGFDRKGNSLFLYREEDLCTNVPELYSNINSNNIEQTNKALKYIYIDINQKNIRLEFKVKENFENYVFLKNYHILNDKIIKKGLVINLEKSKYLSTYFKK